MRIAVLTHAEAADSAVFANLAKHLLGGADTIAYVDRPDVGAPDAPLALAQPVASPSPAALAFGGQSTPPAAVPVPAVPSTPTAATVPTAAPAASPAGVTVDAAGLPWDARIHSSNKAFVADGTWRQRRGTAPDLLAKVEAELRQTMGLPAPAPAAAPAAAPVPQPPAANSVFGAAAIAAGLPQPVLVPPVPAPAVVAPPAAAPTPAPAGDPATFADMMLWLTPHMPHKLSPDQLNGALAANGIPSLNALISRPDLVPGLVAQLKPLVA